MVVRRNSFLDVSTRTYWIGCVLSYIACTITVIYMFEILRKPVEITNAYIEYRYPKYGNVPKENSLLIFSDKKVMRFSIFSCIVISGGLITCYMCLSVLIFLEVRIRVNSMSASMQKYHLKVLKNILQEILIKLVTFIFYPFFTCVQYFVVPEYDSIGITMFLYNIFVAAPIPGTVVLIVQTPSYQQYLMKAFQTRVRVESS
ncbi:Protein CBG13590 [Caenorhabditis briggsae]|uniref:Uncharacterized protein n=2 Tax=Caenorhabditis briggsae TaxID=6238 RepID=A0AAE9EY50_CAEBR|nr:Protein CBG13590 [Caenorhabditis briggsae]ULT98128.1 hypothetical protein L3Y34_005745 [Caenorhabditis briggsae]UMM31293.1 hypothetical protein L5515_012829 [Caenorhabditis briggsae]CAP32368.1 Protein CBG13590 [Caenorhabditis briggsae]